MNGAFIDSNVFLKILEGDEEISRHFLAFSQKKRIYRNAIVGSEVMHVFIRLYTGKKPHEIKTNPDIITEIKTELQKVEKLIDIAQTIPLTHSEEQKARELMREYGLLPNDALIAATCLQHAIPEIATFDNDFKRCPFLTISRLTSE
ncbi:PIN domain-containing protein [Methanofollis formosanus]|uniref:Ribonuclease VapC n=1 Tax=Methanofollis formosanus TaxID=299308 RepID=A0A8G1EG01_9EURY|nr:type II toxin-antitoxin system VapC family toxin [Methanofollis formosanus]QYZ78659.1 PIN domain-containing protein [Methanofollis formosanus]